MEIVNVSDDEGEDTEKDAGETSKKGKIKPFIGYQNSKICQDEARDEGWQRFRKRNLLSTDIFATLYLWIIKGMKKVRG